MGPTRFLAATPRRVRVFGDWHGNLGFALRQIEHGLRDGISTFVHTGDFGLWPFAIPYARWTTEYSFIREIQSLLDSNDAVLGFIDGNHEDFTALGDLPLTSEGLGRVSGNIFHIPRGTAWQWRGTRFAGLGGATSIDRRMRTPGKTWFPQEAITAEDVARAKRARSVDVLFTHEAPFLPVPKRSFGPDIDADCDQSIAYVDEVVSALGPRLVLHGHYHLAYVNRDEVPGTEIVGLDCDAGRASDNYVDLVPGRTRPLAGAADVLGEDVTATDILGNDLLSRLQDYTGQLDPPSKTLVSSALSYATRLHARQVRQGFDGSNRPYLEHPVRVAVRLIDWGVNDPQTIAAALLHDAVEDCRDLIERYLISAGTAEQWTRLQFGDRVASVVAEVTNQPGQSYQAKIRGLVDYGSTCALLVKASDLVDNAGSLPFHGGGARAERLAKKYSGSIPMVEDVLSRLGYGAAARDLAAVARRLHSGR